MTNDDRYSRGKIYKLVSDMTDLIYIGSCCVPLPKRLCNHKSEFKNNCATTKSVELFKLGGSVEIVLIEEYPCASKMELQRRERYHIENNVCVNKCKPARTYEEQLEQMREYRVANREAISEQKRAYHEATREAISKRKKAEYEANKEQRRAYHEANREAILKKNKERVNCPHCNKEMNRNSLSKHIKTQHP